jgi:hypothetical protein
MAPGSEHTIVFVAGTVSPALSAPSIGYGAAVEILPSDTPQRAVDGCLVRWEVMAR